MIYYVLLYCICFAFLAFCSYQALRLFGVSINKQRSKWLYAVMSMINALAVLCAVHFSVRVAVVYILIFAALYIDFCILFDQPAAVSYFGAMQCVLQFICVRGIVTSLMSLLLRITLFEIMASETHRLITLIISMLMLIICVYLALRHKELRDLFSSLFSFRAQLLFVNTIGSLMLLYQLFCTDSFFHLIDYELITLMLLFGDILSLVGYHLVLSHSMRASVWLRQISRTQSLEALLKRQLLHYRSYGEYSASILRFKHDYNKIISSVRSLIRAGEPEKALSVLEDMDHCLQNNVSVHKQYSDDMLVDAVLHELADECLEIKAVFSAGVKLPDWLKIKQLELNTLFTALSHELSSHCVQTPEGTKRYIRVTGEYSQDWLTVTGETSFGGKIRDLPDHTINKDEPDWYDMSLPDVRKVASAIGGFVNVQADTVALIYRVSIHIDAVHSGGTEADE